jgi:hypothetical protein
VTRILVPTTRPDDWQRFLAGPEKQWRDGFSAKELAKRWEEAGGIPGEVAKLFHESGVPAFASIDLLAAFPEWQTALEGRGKASHSDILVIARTGGGLITITVEGKASEPFGDTVADWLHKATRGKEQNRLNRLAFLRRTIGLTDVPVDSIRYQLLHRAAAAVLEARAFHARYAAMIVHSFCHSPGSLRDCQALASLYSADAPPGKLVKLRELDGIELFGGWANWEPGAYGCRSVSADERNPFGSYPNSLKDNPRCLAGTACRTGYGLMLQQITGQTRCAYCDLDISDTYDHWLHLSVDHVIPASMAKHEGWREWVDNADNMVICCSACNGFLNGFRICEDAVAPTTFEEFAALRAAVFRRKQAKALERHKGERQVFDSRPWEQEIDPDTLTRRP